MLVRRIQVGDRNRFETHDVKSMVFESPWADILVKDHRAVCERHFTTVETSDSQVAVVRFDGKLARIVGPGKRILFWRGPVTVTAELIDVKENPEAPAAMLGALSRLTLLAQVDLTYAQVEEGKTGLLFIENRLIRALGPGAYGFWNVAGTPRVEVVDLRRQTLEIPGQEILTKDKVSQNARRLR